MQNRIFKRIGVTLCICLALAIAFGLTCCKTPTYPMTNQEKSFSVPAIEPFKVGSPLGEDECLTEKRYWGSSTRWITAGTGAVVCGAIAFACPPVAFGIPIAAGVGYGVGLAMEAYCGGPYDYDAYEVPKEPATVVFWFSGADEGACGYKDFRSNSDYSRAAGEFGWEHVAMFNFLDVDKALEYAAKLPSGSRLVVRGHSMGGASAFRFARRLPEGLTVLLLDTRDPTSWFGHADEKPGNVEIWCNFLPGDAKYFTPEKDHKGTNYFGKLNAANLFMMMGRPWGICSGAENLVREGRDHHEVGFPRIWQQTRDGIEPLPCYKDDADTESQKQGE